MVPYFLGGMLMAKYYERILPRIKGIVLGLSGVFNCIIAAIMVCKVQQIWIIRNVETILFISGLWLICLALVNVRIKRMGFLKMIAEYSMDIYLLSYFVQVPIRVIVNNLIPFEIPYFLIVSGMFGAELLFRFWFRSMLFDVIRFYHYFCWGLHG